MPLTTWKEAAGHKCGLCHGLATHEHKGMWICCDCHVGKGPGSGWLTQEMIAEYHRIYGAKPINDDSSIDINFTISGDS